MTPSTRMSQIFMPEKFTDLKVFWVTWMNSSVWVVPVSETYSTAITDMTVIEFSVRVPVLSEQIWVAPPMVSEEAIFLTRLLSFCILALEKLSEIVTASGRPSGMATTTTVIPMMMASRSSG